jgi:predicted nucleic acid-binding protein
MGRAGRDAGNYPRLHIAEPRAAYLHRPPLVVDASIVAAALFDEDGRDEAAALLHGRTLHAPHLLDYEIANVGLKKQRRENVAAAALDSAFEAYARLSIERHAVDATAIAAVAARYELTAYDAAYLCVAEALMAPLATLDGKLAAAARAHLMREREIHEP